MIDESTTRRRVIQGAGIIGVTGIVGSSVVGAQESPTPTAGETALRVTHASPDAPPVSVRLDDQTVVEELSFGSVTDYQTVEPGSYQLQIVSAEGGGGLLGDLFGSNQQDQPVLYDQEVTIEQGTTYTAVAFGEAGEGSAATPTPGTATPDGGTTPTPTVQDLQMGGGGQAGPLVEGLAFGESATATVPAGDYRLLVRPTDEDEETPEDGQTPTEAGTPAASSAFQVALLEDDLSSPPEEQSRVRVFHAVPNLDEVTIVATPQGGGQGPPQTPGQGQGPDGGPGQGQGPDGGPGQSQDPPISADVSLEAGTVYSSFALGYAPAEEETPTPDDVTPDDATPTDGAGTPADDERPEFELVVVETATDGERVQGGGS